MKKMLMTALMMAGTLSVMADDYPYLTFETADGTKVSFGSSSLTITIQNGKLMAGSKEFNLSDLSKMYFSTTNESMTTEIAEVKSVTIENDAEIYDLQGRKVSKGQNGRLPRGIYVIKTKQGTRKVNVK